MIELLRAEGLVDVPQLVGVDVEVVVGDDAADELAVEVVVGGVDGADAPVRVRVAVRARTEAAVLKGNRNSYFYSNQSSFKSIKCNRY